MSRKAQTSSKELSAHGTGTGAGFMTEKSDTDTLNTIINAENENVASPALDSSGPSKRRTTLNRKKEAAAMAAVANGGGDSDQKQEAPAAPVSPKQKQKQQRKPRKQLQKEEQEEERAQEHKREQGEQDDGGQDGERNRDDNDNKGEPQPSSALTTTVGTRGRKKSLATSDSTSASSKRGKRVTASTVSAVSADEGGCESGAGNAVVAPSSFCSVAEIGSEEVNGKSTHNVSNDDESHVPSVWTKTLGRQRSSTSSARAAKASAGNAAGKNNAMKTTKFVFNAYDTTKHQQIAKSNTSDDENVILRLNVHDKDKDKCGTGGTNGQQQPEAFRDDDEESSIMFDEGSFDADSQSYTYSSSAKKQMGKIPSAYDETSFSQFTSRPSIFEANEGFSHHHDNPHSGVMRHAAEDIGHPHVQPYLPLQGCQRPQLQPHLRKMRLLMEFEEKNKANEWPANTNIHCYWCCHRFYNHPYGIPLKYVNNRFYVHGCFCSLECATAYNFGNGGSIDEMWERYSLINMMAHRLFENNESEENDHKENGHCDDTCTGGSRSSAIGMVRQAPHRLALAMFGGHLSIEEFRSYCPSHRLTVINFPPMMTLTQQVEEINDTDVQSTHKYVPIPSERIDRYQKEIKLKRTKPLVNKNNTLINAMNIRYHS